MFFNTSGMLCLQVEDLGTIPPSSLEVVVALVRRVSQWLFPTTTVLEFDTWLNRDHANERDGLGIGFVISRKTNPRCVLVVWVLVLASARTLTTSTRSCPAPWWSRWT